MDFNIIRGDTCSVLFSILDASGNPYILSNNDKCWFTVKKDFREKDFVLQKRYKDGIVYNEEKSKYQIDLSQDDTNLDVGNYVYDIKVKIGDRLVRTLVIDSLSILDNVTRKENE